jgi:hypothetical protein
MMDSPIDLETESFKMEESEDPNTFHNAQKNQPQKIYPVVIFK